MDRLFKIGAGFFLFATVLLVVAIILPTTIRIEKKIIIDKNPKSIFKQVNNLKNWTKWTPSIQNDSTIIFGTKTIGKGASYSWKNNNKIGILQITESNPPFKIITQMLFDNKNPIINEWTFEPTAEGCIVIIKMSFKIPFPFNVMGPLAKKSIGKDFELTLENIKTATP